MQNLAGTGCVKCYITVVKWDQWTYNIIGDCRCIRVFQTSSKCLVLLTGPQDFVHGLSWKLPIRGLAANKIPHNALRKEVMLAPRQLSTPRGLTDCHAHSYSIRQRSRAQLIRHAWESYATRAQLDNQLLKCCWSIPCWRWAKQKTWSEKSDMIFTEMNINLWEERPLPSWLHKDSQAFVLWQRTVNRKTVN